MGPPRKPLVAQKACRRRLCFPRSKENLSFVICERINGIQGEVGCVCEVKHSLALGKYTSDV